MCMFFNVEISCLVIKYIYLVMYINSNIFILLEDLCLIMINGIIRMSFCINIKVN